jgi:putative peptidoglycan lipid II flippase
MTSPPCEPAVSPEKQSRSNAEPGEAEPAGPQSRKVIHALGPAARLLKRSTTVSSFTALGVGIGFLVDVLLVARFGIGVSTDAYFGGYTIPLILVTCLVAIEPVLVTILAGHRQDESAFSILLNAAGLVGLTVAALGILLARPLVQGTMPGFPPETAAQATLLARILFARVPGTAVAEVCKAELYTRRRFGLATFSNVFPSLLTAVVLVLPRTGTAIEVVAASVVAGTLLQAVVLTAALFGPFHLPYRFTLRHTTPLLSQTGRLLVAPLVGLLLRQGVVLAERFFGSNLQAGSVTALSYASRLTMTVAGISFDGISTAALPSLAERWSQGATKEARDELAALLKLMLIVAVPVGLLAAALGTPLVLLFFQRGQVDRQGALLMGTLFSIYSLSLLGLGPFRAAQNLFYAVKEMRPIIILHGSLTAVTLVLDWILVRRMGVTGLALSFAVSSAIIAVAAMVWMAEHVGNLDWRRLGDLFWKWGLASLAMAGVAIALGRWLQQVTQQWGRWGLVLVVILSGVGGALALVGIASLLRAEPISVLWRAVRERVVTRRRRRSSPSGDAAGRTEG